MWRLYLIFTCLTSSNKTEQPRESRDGIEIAQLLTAQLLTGRFSCLLLHAFSPHIFPPFDDVVERESSSVCIAICDIDK